MASQRERIFQAIQRLGSRNGSFGPDVPTEEQARELRQLGRELMEFGRRELGRFRVEALRAGRLNRAEVLDDDMEDALEDAFTASIELRRCPTDQVDQWRVALHSALDTAAHAATDPAHRADAGQSREARPSVRDMIEARRGDVEERRQLAEARDRALGLVADAERAALAAESKVAHVADQLARLGVTRDQLVANLAAAQADREELESQLGASFQRINLSQAELERVMSQLESRPVVATPALGDGGDLRLL